MGGQQSVCPAEPLPRYPLFTVLCEQISTQYGESLRQIVCTLSKHSIWARLDALHPVIADIITNSFLDRSAPPCDILGELEEMMDGSIVEELERVLGMSISVPSPIDWSQGRLEKGKEGLQVIVPFEEGLIYLHLHIQ